MAEEAARAWPPSVWMAIAVSAAVTCSPVAASASISRASGTGDDSWASSSRRLVSPLIALTMTTTSLPALLRGERAGGDVADAVECADGRAAELLDDEGHGWRDG